MPLRRRRRSSPPSVVAGKVLEGVPPPGGLVRFERAVFDAVLQKLENEFVWPRAQLSAEVDPVLHASDGDAVDEDVGDVVAGDRILRHRVGVRVSVGVGARHAVELVVRLAVLQLPARHLHAVSQASAKMCQQVRERVPHNVPRRVVHVLCIVLRAGKVVVVLTSPCSRKPTSWIGF